MKYILILFISTILFSGCEKTDKVDNEQQWIIKANNQTSLDAELNFFDFDSQDNNKSFTITSGTIAELFKGANGIFELDPISRKDFDSVLILFADDKSISYILTDTSSFNVLLKDNYERISDSEYIFNIDNELYNKAE
ncbi:MAG: hypothetical protein JEZ09_13905 [Salinivirgaceae bacterium]|nr:hypothetical protein [Salinivirgaceae bacterium]